MTRNDTELREAITRSRAGQTRWRCPAPLREEIVGFTQERRREGVSVKKIATQLGMSESGLNRWLQKADGRLRPVRVIEKSSSRDLVLVTPGGYRLEGLSSSSAADVLRRLGC